MFFDGETGGRAGLDPDTVARRVVDLLDSSAVGERYLDTPAVARMLGVSEEWVRDHASELEAIRLGDGPRGALRFELERIRRALDRRRLAMPRQTPPRRRPARRVAGVRLLPPARFPEGAAVSVTLARTMPRQATGSIETHH